MHITCSPACGHRGYMKAIPRGSASALRYLRAGLPIGPSRRPCPPSVRAVAGAEEAQLATQASDGTQHVSQAYPFSDIESKWQAYWEEHQTFRTPESVDTSKPKYYVLDMFPYPSGSGLHVGHPEGYTATDIMARYKRMTGHNVLHPMGWDAFGLPAEQYAIQTGTHPAVTTKRNVAVFREQLKALGFSYDWQRELATTDPEYYKWTQWIFTKLLEMDLAYQAEVPVNWCPELGTVLANEEVVDGVSERGGFPVVRLPMRQWMLRITRYADRLLADLDTLNWPDSIKEMQRNWIGRSEGARISFHVAPGEGAIASGVLEVFTTRPDTLHGTTYMVIAPEHAMLAALTTPERAAAVNDYVAAAARKSDLERTELQTGKSGLFLGSHAINPATGEAMPVYVADYVLGSYGSGAIMAVPGHDERDYEFAQTFDLPIKQVVAPADGAEVELPYTAHGVSVNSTTDSLDISNQPTADAAAAVITWLEETGAGTSEVNYKLRDWLFARQRYWGEPFPVVYPEGSDEVVPVPEAELPVRLPDIDDYKPSGKPESPLVNATEWLQTTDPRTGGPARRDTNTMPQWAGSCWYYLRYIDPKNNGRMVDPELEAYWMPVDLYVGGAEHAVLHLLYARFWHKVLHDIGVVSTSEPFQSLVSQGMILGETEYSVYRDADGNYTEPEAPGATAERVALEDITKVGDKFVLRADEAVAVGARAHKMSKSRGNVINPDVVVTAYGADSLRLYEMFMGPLRDTKVWSTKSVEGVHRFLARVWRTFENGVDEVEPTKAQLRALHKAIDKVTLDTDDLRFNTAIAAMMEFMNDTKKWDNRPRAALEPLLLLLAPYAPHLAEECWARCGHEESLTYAPWPQADPALLVEDEIVLPVQVNGKMRGKVSVAADVGQEAAVELARGLGPVLKQLEGKEVKKIIFVPRKILNIIAK
eukprot:jgi/Ulvmu1/11895/UM081_0054.1